MCANGCNFLHHPPLCAYLGIKEGGKVKAGNGGVFYPQKESVIVPPFSCYTTFANICEHLRMN